jgi:hypothetical protein
MERASDSGTNRLGDNLTILVLSGNEVATGTWKAVASPAANERAFH